MNRQQLLNLIKRAGWVGEYDNPSRYVQFSCPFAPWTHEKKSDSHPSFSFDLLTNCGRCFTCDERGSLYGVMSFIGLLTGNRKLVEIAEASLGITSETDKTFDDAEARLGTLTAAEETNRIALEAWCLTLPKADTITAAREYLSKRCFNPDVCSAYDLRWDRDENRIVLPIYTPEGKFIGCQGRTTIDADPKTKHYWGTKSTQSFGFAHAFNASITSLDPKNAILLVEGPYDMFRLNTFVDDITVLCLFGASISKTQIKYLQTWYKPVFALMDNDEAGRKGGQQIVVKLRHSVPSVTALNLPEHRKDPDELDREEFFAILNRREK